MGDRWVGQQAPLRSLFPRPPTLTLRRKGGGKKSALDRPKINHSDTPLEPQCLWIQQVVPGQLLEPADLLRLPGGVAAEFFREDRGDAWGGLARGAGVED